MNLRGNNKIWQLWWAFVGLLMICSFPLFSGYTSPSPSAVGWGHRTGLTNRSDVIHLQAEAPKSISNSLFFCCCNLEIMCWDHRYTGKKQTGSPSHCLEWRCLERLWASNQLCLSEKSVFFVLSNWDLWLLLHNSLAYPN